jgi:hypothetical protein
MLSLVPEQGPPHPTTVISQEGQVRQIVFTLVTRRRRWHDGEGNADTITPVKRVFKNDESPQLHQHRGRDRSYAPRLRGTHERTRITTNGIAQIHIGHTSQYRERTRICHITQRLHSCPFGSPELKGGAMIAKTGFPNVTSWR